MTYHTLLTEVHENVLLIRLNRPHALNALNEELIHELQDVLKRAQDNAALGCMILTGSEKAFAAGADISEMHHKTYPDVYLENFICKWEALEKVRKPILAAVAGFALGGGCELAMMCDFILAAENAQFGQPEIKLGIMPGAGGTQRLTRLIGKSKAMEMCLTGRMMDAQEAERVGLVSRILPLPDLIPDAISTAQMIAHFSRPAVWMIKESIQQAYEMELSAGLRFERRLFHATFATQDQKEGMAAFMEKRPAKFEGM